MSTFRYIGRLSVIIKCFEIMSNRKFADHLNRENTHGEKYDMVFTCIIIAVYISKAFEIVWNKPLLHKLAGNGISRRAFSVIKSFISGWTMNIDFN